MASFGETLKRERELREISLRQIAEATKISMRYLEALEENRFDVLPGGLFNKGFIRAYATFIGVDSETMVNSYLHELSARQQGAGATPARDLAQMHRPAEVPQRRSGGGPAPPAATAAGAGDVSRSIRPAVTGIEVVERAAPRSSRALVWILSLVAAAGVLFLLLSLLRGAMPATSHPADRPVMEGGDSPHAPGGGTDPGSETAGEAPPGTSALLPDMSGPSPITLSALAAAPPARAPAGDNRAAPAPAENAPASAGREAPGPMNVEIEARGRTFVQVVCDGRETMSRVMEAGETEQARCEGVVRVSVTDAGAARIAVNGAQCLPLGDPGTRAYGYTIRIDDYARICPPAGRRVDGRH